MKIYQIEGKCLSPVHIGTGETWEPLNYYIDEGSDCLYWFSTERLIDQLTDKERDELNGLIDSSDLNQVRNFITNKAKVYKISDIGSGIPVTPQVKNLYKDNLINIENQLQIQPMIRQKGNDRAIIPGSSLKGAIRTAIISELALVSKLQKPSPFGREPFEFEAKVMQYNDAKNDPFRAVKLADAHLNEDATMICQVANAGIRQGVLEPKSMQLIYEVTQSVISTGDDCAFKTEIRFDDDLMQKKGGVSQKISLHKLIDSCNSFYKEKLESEHAKFYESSHLKEVSEKLLKEEFGSNECLVRVGRFSGVESVTLDYYRDPQPPGKVKKWGNTRNIADSRYPMGWVKLKFVEM